MRTAGDLGGAEDLLSRLRMAACHDNETIGSGGLADPRVNPRLDVALAQPFLQLASRPHRGFTAGDWIPRVCNQRYARRHARQFVRRADACCDPGSFQESSSVHIGMPPFAV